ncbi:hypothetical protein LPJ66_007382 [Kickxella alabastrina]|uniref:Uncharacterized protein n=1 Tax=Kickxella alabastrina TaxID=61397 RepID=A0ACC1IDB4_9FUNG|nr:hypothetical protein LPJ66_007382 [Kickxella alabastrina]
MALECIQFGEGDSALSADSQIPRRSSGIWTNFGYYHRPQHAELAHTLFISINGESPSPGALVRLIQSSGFDCGIWPAVSKLKMRSFSPSGNSDGDSRYNGEDHSPQIIECLNGLLADHLPALSAIFYDNSQCSHLYRHFPLNQLVDRCINGPVALETLDISTDVPSALSQYQSTPLEVTDLRIRFVDFSAGSRFPRLIAKSLVSLSLDSVSASTLWEIFVASNTARTADFEFTCLQLLNLQFDNISGFIFATQRNHSDPVDFPADPTIPALQYMQSQKYGTPRFPALLKLAVSQFPGQIQELLSLFASSPLQKLKVEGSRFELPSKLDVSAFAKLKSLAVSCMGVEDLDPDREYLQQLLHHAFKTPPAQLEYMSLAIGCQEIATDFSQLLEISFADNLRVLRLDSFIDVSGTLLLLLAKLPRLQHLIITSATCKPLRSIEQVVETICNEGDRLTPVSDSIYMLDLYFGFPGIFVCDISNKDSSFRGLIPELLCRLPALRILRTKQLYMASEGGPGAVISQVASDHTVSARFGHLQNPWVQQLDASA